MRRKLVVSGGTRERELQLVGRIVFGRDPTCDVSHDHSLLSRRHAEIETKGHDVIVRDLGSRNGVFVNGARTVERNLKPGDVVQIGPLRARYVVDNAPATVEPEEVDAGRTAVFGSRRPSRTDTDPVVIAPALAGFGDDDEATRMVPAPRLTASAAPVPASIPADDEEVTRFVRPPAFDDADSSTDATVAVGAPDVAEALRVIDREKSVRTFVFVQSLVLASIVLIAAMLPPAAGLSGRLWFGLSVPAAVVAALVVGAAINRRIEQASAGGRDRS